MSVAGPQPTTTEHATVAASRAAEDPTIGRLVADASRDVSRLIQDEIALAKKELKTSVTSGGLAIALFAVAAFLGLLSIIFLSIAIAFFISMTGLHLAWSFLIVWGGYLLLIAVLVLVAVRRLKKVRAPQRAIRQAQESAAVLSRRGS